MMRSRVSAARKPSRYQHVAADAAMLPITFADNTTGMAPCRQDARRQAQRAKLLLLSHAAMPRGLVNMFNIAYRHARGL